MKFPRLLHVLILSGLGFNLLNSDTSFAQNYLFLSAGQLAVQQEQPDDEPGQSDPDRPASDVPEDIDGKPGNDSDTDESNDAPPRDEEQESVESAGQSKATATGRSPKPKRRSGAKTFSKDNEEFLAVFSPVVSSTSDSVVRVFDADEQIALGTIVDPDGYILTKASELRGEPECLMADGSRVKPDVVGIDPDTDLVLLKVDRTGLAAAPLETALPPPVGSWLATVDQNQIPLSIGIVSHEVRAIKNRLPNEAVIGIIPDTSERPETPGVRINRIFEDTAAERAGLLVNDIIISIDEEPIKNRLELLDKLATYQPGDEITVVIKRGEKELSVPVVLGKRKVNPMMDRGLVQNRMGSKLSKRRSNFPLAIQHDSALNADECGSPVVDLDGRIIGINIARDGRVSSLALPNDVVIPVINRLKSGKYQPEIVNRKQIEWVQKELDRLASELIDLPEEKIELEKKFAAGSALEKEFRNQLDELRAKMKELKSRFDERKKENGQLVDSIAEIDNKKNRIERKRQPLERELKQLKTGVK